MRPPSRLGILVALVALVALAGPAAAQPGQVYDPNAPVEPPPDDPEPYRPPPRYESPPPARLPPPNATRATFVSMGEARWDVRIEGNAVCTTPCSLVVEPLRFVTLHSQARTPTKLSVGYMPTGDVIVRAQPRAEGKFAAGVTFTALTGMGLVTGITLTAVGCSTDRDRMCNAGLITGVASAVGLYLSIGMLRSALPRVHIDRNTVGVGGQF